MFGDYRITEAGTQFIIAASDLQGFKAHARSLGLVIVRSSPVGLGYAITVR